MTLTAIALMSAGYILLSIGIAIGEWRERRFSRILVGVWRDRALHAEEAQDAVMAVVREWEVK